MFVSPATRPWAASRLLSFTAPARGRGFPAAAAEKTVTRGERVHDPVDLGPGAHSSPAHRGGVVGDHAVLVVHHERQKVALDVEEGRNRVRRIDTQLQGEGLEGVGSGHVLGRATPFSSGLSPSLCPDAPRRGAVVSEFRYGVDDKRQ